jgi:hypothetical protein
MNGREDGQSADGSTAKETATYKPFSEKGRVFEFDPSNDRRKNFETLYSKFKPFSHPAKTSPFASTIAAGAPLPLDVECWKSEVGC